MILVTGASGFVGKALTSKLLKEDNPIKVIVRTESSAVSLGVKHVSVVDFEKLSSSVYSSAMKNGMEGVEVIIHAVARVHVMQENSLKALSKFRKVNKEGTLVFAKLAAEAGVKRFIFISSIKVNGEITKINHPFLPDDEQVPTDPYGLSKYEAEQGLLALAEDTGMEVVIIRPPLVYGPGVKANFASMMQWMNKRIPLPFGSIHNKRSLVALDNLVDFIALCADIKRSPKAANQVFLISDNEDVSTTELLKKVAKAQNKKAWLIPVPVSWLIYAAKLMGKSDLANRLFGSLQVDSSKAHNVLGWKPVISMDEQLKKMAKVDINEKNI